jgi:hypothetical protein
MILLAVTCVGLYLLGGVLAFELCVTDESPGIEETAKRVVAVVAWPSLAVYLLFSRSDQKNEEST